MRQLAVYMNNDKAGVLTENTLGKDYIFCYDEEYLLSELPPVSVTLPKRKEGYKSEYLFPFFTNMIPEGANRKVICVRRGLTSMISSECSWLWSTRILSERLI